MPELDQRVVAGLLTAHIPLAKGRRLVLVQGKYAAGSPEEFTLSVGEGERRSVRVVHSTSVLGITDAWQAHLADSGTDSSTGSRTGTGNRRDVLVVTTDVPDDRLGLDLVGEMMRSHVIKVDEADIVKQLFGAADLDPRMRRDPWLWLPAALIAAEPAAGGWPQHGAVLTLDAAMRALVGCRLGLIEVFEGGGSVDMDALLAWSRTPGGPEQFAALEETERSGIAGWLEQSAGDAAPLLLRLALNGRGAEATALGVLASAVAGDNASPDAAMALGTLFGAAGAKVTELRAYARAVEGTLTRWIDEAAGRGDSADKARQRVLEVLRQADELATAAHLTDALADNPFLPSSFQSRLRLLAEALPAGPEAAQTAWEHVRDHRTAALFAPHRVELAQMAVRLTRWLDEPEPQVTDVDQAVRAQAADWGLVDRALTQLRSGDAEAAPALARAYQDLHDAAQRRRRTLDETFASKLAAWAAHATAGHSEGALLIEDVLEQIVAPLAMKKDRPRPLLIVLDAMSSAVAAQLGEELTSAARWSELAAGGQRAAAVAMIPSVTVISRATLLSGRPTSGGQSVEQEGFTTFWRDRHRLDSSLFHKADIPGPPGHLLHPRLVAALASDDVVAVVLNAIDDSLDHGQQGSVSAWSAADITYLPELLNAARGQGRPVVLVSDHGHVLDQADPGEGPVPAEGVESARWRTGTVPGEGEVQLAGPRILENGGRVTVPWDERIRYTPRKAGYHGGATLAEMTVPVLVLAPSAAFAPAGWSEVSAESVQPQWWKPREGTPGAPAPVEPARNPVPPKQKPRPQEGVPFTDDAVKTPAGKSTPPSPEPVGLGPQVVATKIYEDQGKYVRKAPDRKVVAAVIDALDAAGGTLSLAAVTAAVTASGGRTHTRPEGLVTMLTRLLNIEGYEVIGLVDSRTRVRLDRDMLREQFELTGQAGSAGENS
ncbi:BREX-2 system phosphatase PglZ [Streptomyces sp. HNM0574]|uniref:BREX-2 system phosphatase PglZ n=1 Tax=Streptomyces sp. HNM0574 TaxID=2714954 RepID=UPI0032179772